MSEEVKEQVLEAMSEPVESAPTETDKEAPSGEVTPKVKEVETPKVETKEPEKSIDVDKINEELKNIKTALSQERDEKKRLGEELNSTKSFYEKMKSAFSPDEPEKAPEEKSEADKFEEWYSQKEAAKAESAKTEELQKTITKQIEDMSKEWDGTEWKPKYDDAEIYKWQKENGKTHLMPEEAFFLMKREDLLDWKANQTLAKAKKGIGSEKPSGISSEHTTNEAKPKTDEEIKKAVFDAISSSDEL